ncbi:MAG: glycosyltransferase family 2 protein [Anaerolineales bacterium]|nr:glycosyltransferase family 2 protein [Anaerolineales bacterium]
MPDISIIIINWNTRDLLAECLESLYKTISGTSFDIWVVDNASTDDSVEMVQTRFPSVQLILNRDNVGFARANNQAMIASQGRTMLLFNSDAVATPGAVAALMQIIEAHPQAGIVGAHLVNPDGSFQASHSPFPHLWQEFLILSGLGRLIYGRWYPSRGPQEAKGPQPVDYVEGACLLVRREAFEQAGGLDEGYFMYAEEVDWCYSMRRTGWQVWYQPAARIIHYGGGSSRNRRTQREADLYRSRVRFFRKHYGDAAALALKTLIYLLTAIKVITHGTLRLLSGNRRGRAVVGISDLMTALRNV